MNYRYLFCALATAASLSLTACGPSANLQIKSVDLNTSLVNQDTYVNMNANISMGNLQFPNVEVPIFNPKTFVPIGDLTLQAMPNGTNQITVAVDFTQVAKLDSSLGTTLPNGREIPTVLGASGATLVGVNILSSSRVYVGGDVAKDLYAGAAIAISALDSVTSQLPVPMNVFFSFPFASQFTGVGGLYTSPTKGQNGIAVFVKKVAPTPASPMGATILSVVTSRGDQTAQAQVQVANGTSELSHMDTPTLFKLNHFFNQRARVRVK